MICKMCLQEKELVDSHIIPRSFFEHIKTSKKPSVIISNKKGEFTKKSNIGIYDQIVCLECERMFQEYDRYAKNFLLGYDGVKQEIRDGEEKLAYIVPEYDYHNLKFYCIINNYCFYAFIFEN